MRPCLTPFVTLCLLFSCGQKTESVQETEYLIAYNTFEPDSLAKDNWEIRIIALDSGAVSKNLTNHPDVAWAYLAHEDKINFISDRDTAYRNFSYTK